MPDRTYYTYIMASRSKVLYTGMTNSITRRNEEHERRGHDSFTAEHRCTRLVWYAVYDNPGAAIDREKKIKGWTRAKKIALIEEANPRWLDLSEQWGKPISKYGEPDNPGSPGTTTLHTRREKRSTTAATESKK